MIAITKNNTLDNCLEKNEKMVILGKVSGVFGVQGWIKLTSATEQPEGILQYNPWQLQNPNGWRSYKLLMGKVHGKGLIAHLDGLNDRDQAYSLVGCKIAIPRNQLPVLAQDDFYWSDLEGLKVQTQDGINLGTVSHLLDAQANDVLVIKGKREHLIPYLWGQIVKRVDLANNLLIVDWDPTF